MTTAAFVAGIALVLDRDSEKESTISTRYNFTVLIYTSHWFVGCMALRHSCNPRFESQQIPAPERLNAKTRRRARCRCESDMPSTICIVSDDSYLAGRFRLRYDAHGPSQESFGARSWRYVGWLVVARCTSPRTGIPTYAYVHTTTRVIYVGHRDTLTRIHPQLEVDEGRP